MSTYAERMSGGRTGYRYGSPSRRLDNVPVIPARDMRPDLVNGMTADAQWDYRYRSAMPQVPLPRGFPRGWPACDANELRDYFAARRAEREAGAAAPARRPRRNLRARVAQLERFIRDAGLDVPQEVAA